MTHRLAGAMLAATALLSACSATGPVRPWEKGELARPEMRMDDPADARIAEKAFASRESASGGGRVGSGGCGCN